MLLEMLSYEYVGGLREWFVLSYFYLECKICLFVIVRGLFFLYYS